jgi:aspartate-semialdehyde dehydrogenase
MKKRYNVAVVGVGAVGIQMLRCLRRRNFPIKELRVFARSSRDIQVDGITYRVKAIRPEGFDDMDIALFAGTEGEKGAAVTFAPEAIKRGAVVIDNGADFRLKKDVPLVIPEVNAEDIRRHKGIIANPNCSTIQMVVAIYPIYKRFGIKRIIVSSYQAASGAGRAAVKQLWDETKGIVAKQGVRGKRQERILSSSIQHSASRVLPQQIAFNVFPHIGSFQEDGYTSEEMKMVYEACKILHDNKIKISATCVRVPVRTGHCEAIYIETKKPAAAGIVKEALSKAKGLRVIDKPEDNRYPLPLDCEGKDDVFVGRIRNDPFSKFGLWLWVVSDNLLKGAALNAIQIAELLTNAQYQIDHRIRWD